MALREKDLTAASLQTGLGADKINPAKSAENVCITVDADAQDEELWERTFAASQDTLSRLAARSRAHREAGRTKKVSA